jgi:hypothetical protein
MTANGEDFLQKEPPLVARLGLNRWYDLQYRSSPDCGQGNSDRESLLSAYFRSEGVFPVSQPFGGMEVLPEAKRTPQKALRLTLHTRSLQERLFVKSF